MGTTLSLLPLPMIEIIPSSKLISLYLDLLVQIIEAQTNKIILK